MCQRYKETESDGEFNWAKFNIQSSEFIIVRQNLVNIVLNLEKIKMEYKLF